MTRTSLALGGAAIVGLLSFMFTALPVSAATDAPVCTTTPTTIVSDTSTTVTGGSSGDGNAVLVSPINAAWVNIPGASWIWGETLSDADAVTGTTETFTKTFTVTGTTTGSLDLSADNGYVLTVNGTQIDDQSSVETNYSSVHHYDLTNLVEGTNTLVITVTNFPLAGSTALTNPAGLIYSLTLNDVTCPNPPPPQNSCVAPSTSGGGTEQISFGSSDEPTLQNILDGAGYSLNAATDQTNVQEWDGTNNTVSFTATFLAKYSVYTHTFGYFVNGDPTFHPIFSDGVNPLYPSTPVEPAAGAESFSVPNVNNVVFAIDNYDGANHNFYYTENSLNPSSEQHTVVYNPSTNEYVIAFEDLPTGSGDNDYNDLVVKLDVSSDCQGPPNTATVVATKIVCDSPSDLPDLNASSHPTDATTATDFLATHPDCHVEPGWQFEWGNDQAGDGGDATIGHVDGYTTFGVTDADGVATTTVPLDNIGAAIHMREVLQSGYIPFTYSEHPDNSDTDSAQFACGTDGLNYDNWDFITNPQAGATYYCVAYNVPTTPPPPVCNADSENINLLQNPSFESPTVTNAAGWDIFPSGTPGLDWNVDWYGGATTFHSVTRPAIANAELQTNGLLGVTAADGSQWTELDSDWDGPSGSLNGEPASVTLSQDVPTVPGTTYHVSFDFMPRPDNPSVSENAIDALYDGIVGIHTDATAGAGWTSHTYDFVATTTTTTIAFRDAGTPDSEGTFLDDTSMTCVPPQDTPPPPSTIKVHIYKYLDNGDGGSAQVPDDSSAPNFPMVSTWSAANIGSGTGNYYLGDNEGGTALRYAADTSPMSVPADYTTNEITDGTTVVPDEDSCLAGKYYLEGYQTGATLADAQAATLTQTVPTFTGLTTDESVIVVNGLCPSDDDGPTGTLHVIKDIVQPESQNATADQFSFVIDGDTVVPFNANGENDVTVSAGNHDVTEVAASGYTTTYSEGGDTTDCDDVDVPAGGDATCTITNTAQPATLTIVKDTTGGDGTFGFNVTGEDTVEVETTNGFGTSTDLSLDGGTTTVSENVPEGWDFSHVSCVSANDDSSGSIIENGEQIVLANGDHVTCTFSDTKQAEGQTNTPPVADDQSVTTPENTPLDVTLTGSDADSDPITFAVATDPTNGVLSGSGADLIYTPNNGYTGPDSFTFVTNDGQANSSPATVAITVTPPAGGGGGGGSGGGGGGGGGSGSISIPPVGSVLSASTSTGQVLGASTCSILLTTYMRYGHTNNSGDVGRLQSFLDEEMGANIPVTGFFGKLTDSIVRAFQLKYATDVLVPWIGIPGSNITSSTTTTGYVYKTTEWKINMIYCPSLDLPFPQLP